MAKRKPGPASGLWISKRYSLAFFWSFGCALISGAMLRTNPWVALGALFCGTVAIGCYILGQSHVDANREDPED